MGGDMGDTAIAIVYNTQRDILQHARREVQGRYRGIHSGMKRDEAADTEEYIQQRVHTAADAARYYIAENRLLSAGDEALLKLMVYYCNVKM